MASVDKQMVALDKKIDELSDKAATATGDTKVRSDQAIADLKSQREAVRKEYKELKASTNDTWDRTKSAFQSAWQGLEKDYDKAVAKISSS